MAQLADEATAEAAANAKKKKEDAAFRRYSVEVGFETTIVPKRKIKATATTEVEKNQNVLE